MCNTDSASGLCKLYTHLSEGGLKVCPSQFFTMEMVVLMLMVLWTEVVYMFLREREFGLPRLNVGLPVTIFALHLLATAYWFGESEATLSADRCSQATDDSNDTPVICVQRGPIIALVNCGLLGFTALLFAHIYEHRDDNLARVAPVSEKEMVNLQIDVDAKASSI